MQWVSSFKSAWSIAGDNLDIFQRNAPPASHRLASSLPSETVVKLSFDDDSASGCRLSGVKNVDIKSASDNKLVDLGPGGDPAKLYGGKVDIGAASKVGASWIQKLMSKLHALFRTDVSEEDLACLAGQVARSNLKALHAFSRDCGYQKHPACTNRVCGHRSRFVALVRRRLPSERYLEFLLDFNQFLNHVEVGGPKLLHTIREIQAKLKEHPESREFQKLVNLYSSERGYLPSKGLDFSGCKEEIARIGLTPGQIRAKSHALQAQLAREGLRIGRFEDVVAWMTPSGRGGHPPVFTYIYCSISICIFAFMAGAYPLFLKYSGNGPMSLKSTDVGGCSTPRELASWISINQGQNFVFDYLLLWGGRYAPALEHGQAWRWFTSPLIHQNFQHILANSILLTALAGYVEYHHGTWRTILVFFLTSLAGNFLSATFEDQCLLVVGASGAVFGFMGFYVADYVINFESVKRPLLRIIIVLGFTLFFAFTIFGSQGDSYVSHFSHIGGFVCGIFPSFLIIPNVKEQRCKAAGRLINILRIDCTKRTPKKTGWKALGRSEIWEKSIWSKYCYLFIHVFGFLVLAAMFLALPLYLYANRLSGIECPFGNNVEGATPGHHTSGMN